MATRRILLYLKQFDWVLLAAVLVLVSLGLAAIYSIGLGREIPDFLNFKKQLLTFIAGLVLLFFFSFVDYKIYKKYYLALYGLAILLLLAVLVFGRTIRGTTGWFSFGVANFQPVEIVKLVLLIFLARYLGDRSRELHRFKFVLVSGLAAGALILLVLLQPDLGSALVLFILWFGLLLVAGLKRSHLLLMLAAGVMMIIIAWMFVLVPYQKDRVLTFVNPSADALGRGYNITQAIIAVGSGQVFGRGLGFGSQSQLRFLPESHTDFIYSVLAEELGLAGVALILGFFTLILYRAYRNSREVRDDFGLFLVLGFMILLASQVAINIGMNIGLAPITGITLPFVSYGGSSLIVNLIIVGILESIFARNRGGEIST